MSGGSGRVKEPAPAASERERRKGGGGRNGGDEEEPGTAAGEAVSGVDGRWTAPGPWPSPVLIDRRVGRRLFDLCRRTGLHGEALAEVLGVSMAEIEDYRSGIAPVPAGVVFLAAIHFGIEMDYFFADPPAAGTPRAAGSRAVSGSGVAPKKRARKSP